MTLLKKDSIKCYWKNADETSSTKSNTYRYYRETFLKNANFFLVKLATFTVSVASSWQNSAGFSLYMRTK